MRQNLEDLITTLRASPEVLGIALYGSRRPDDLTPGGDFDLFVIVKERPPDLESIHFYWGGIPVDLNLRTIDDLQANQPLTDFDHALTDAELLYDGTGELRDELSALMRRWSDSKPVLTENVINMTRFGHRHVLDKVRGRIDQEPVLCEFLLTTNIYWLVRTYYRVRHIQYPGEKDALEHLQSEELDLYANIQYFYATRDLEEKLDISKRLTEAILSPIGGPWREGELLTSCTTDCATDLQAMGYEMLQSLLGTEEADRLNSAS